MSKEATHASFLNEMPLRCEQIISSDTTLLKYVDSATQMNEHVAEFYEQAE